MAVAATRGGVSDLLEREPLLEALREAFADARDGRGGVVLVAGEAGVGKTIVLGRFCDEVRTFARVLWGDCDALFTPRPLGPFADIARVTGDRFRELVDGHAKPHAVAGWLLEELEAAAPSVVVLEDVHWADEATLDVLRIVGRRIRSVPALLVVSYRDDELDRSHPLRSVLGELPSRGLVRRLCVSCLSREAVAALAEPVGVDPDELFARTGGNPFFVTEVLGAGVTDVPDTIRDAVLARTGGLDAPARALLDAVAIFPRRAELSLLEAVASPAGDRLEACLRTGVLRSEQGAVAFRHELARLVVEESIAPDQALALHRRALAALAQPPTGKPDLSRLAHHADAAGDREAVLAYAPGAAAEASGLGAHREAASHYARALRHAEELPPRELADLLQRRSHECYLTDQADEAIDALRRAAACYRAIGDRLKEGETLARLGNILWCPGRGEEARQTAREAVDLLEQLPPGRELALAYASLSFVQATVRDDGAAWQSACRALELGEALDDPDVVCHALIQMGWRELSGDPAGGLATIERAAALARERDLVELVSDSYLARTTAAVWTNQADLAQALYDEGLAYARKEGSELHELYLLAHRACLELDRGRWADAVDSAELVLGRPWVSTFPRTLALTVLARARARRGDPNVLPLVVEARALAEPTRELGRMAPVAVAAAEAAWLTGNSGAARDATEEALALAVRVGARHDIASLQAWRKRAGVEEPPHALAAEGPNGLELQGEFEAAAAIWMELGRPYEAALALADIATDPALRRSLELLTDLGARATAAVVTRRLRALGARDIPRGPRPTTLVNPAELTPREVEIVQLLADGLRNAEIAERLFLSERTVENHVSSILRKLGARSRAEAVADARQLGVLRDA
jgi:DNA-binding CsgD family transcriptional regulator/tetratricopeptide (TPR) repeat protein